MSSGLVEPQRTSETVPVTVLMKPQMRAELERLAAEAERSLGGEMRLAIREHLERVDGKETR